MLLNEKSLYEFGEFCLDISERTLWRNGELVALAPKAIETLCLLVEHHGKLMTKDELMAKLWADTFVEDRNLAQNIFTLRKALGEDANGKKFIETIPRRGYRFVAQVRLVEFPKDEVVEVSLSERTKITAEGNVPSHELTEAVKETAKSLSLDKDIEVNPARQIATNASPNSLNRKFSYIILGVLFVAIFGAGFWLWQNYKTEGKQRSFAILDFSNAKLERLTDSGKAFLPAISRDKKQIVYVFNDKGKDSLKLQNLATGSVTEVIPPTADAIISSPFFSKDGDYIFYRFYDGGKEGAIYQVPIYGGSPRKIVGEVRSDASLSPDGDWLSFVRYDSQNDAFQIVVCYTDGTSERVVASRSGERIFLDWGQTPAWSPDGQKIIVGGLTKSLGKKLDEKKIYLLELSVANGSEKVLPTPEWSGIGKFVWLPNQSGLIGLAQERRESPYQIWLVEYPNGKAKRVTNDLSDYGHIDIAPDGEFILASERRTTFNLWIVSLIDKSARQITSKSSIYVGAGGLNWSRDGKQIVFTIAENTYSSNIWTIDVETQKMRQLTFDENKRNWQPIFTPDNQSIIFSSDRSGNSHIWQMDMDGGNLRQITEGSGEWFPQVTADGNRLLYVSPEDAPQFLYKRPIQGGEPILLYNSAKGSNVVSPDSKQVLLSYYDTKEEKKNPWKYGILSLDKSNKEPVEVDVHPFLGGMSWNQTGSGFYYISEGRTLNNIWFYSLADKTTKQITTFDDLRMRFLSLSPDGTQIATSRGSTVSDVIKLSGFN